MENFDSKEFLLFALNHFKIMINSKEGNLIELEKGYGIEIEGEKLFKLIHEGQVVAPFADIEEMCDFIKKDIQLNE